MGSDYNGRDYIWRDYIKGGLYYIKKELYNRGTTQRGTIWEGITLYKGGTIQEKNYIKKRLHGKRLGRKETIQKNYIIQKKGYTEKRIHTIQRRII